MKGFLKFVGKVAQAIGILVVALVVLTFVMCGRSTSKDEDKAGKKTVDGTEQSVSVDGLTVTVPADWEVQEADDGSKHIYPDYGGMFQLSPVIEYGKGDGDTLAGIYEAFISGMMGDKSVRLGDDVQVTEVRKAILYRRTLDLPISGEDYSGYIDVLMSGNRMHVLMFVVPAASAEDHLKEAVRILDGVTLDSYEVPILERGELSSAGGKAATAEEVAEPHDEPERPENEISDDFKAAMDSYEAFFREYVDFMKRYQDDPSNIELLMELADMTAREADMLRDFDAWEEGDMTTAEMAYYLEVQSRIYAMLAEVL